MSLPFPFETERHRDEVPPSSVHPIHYVGTDDPADDAANDVAPGKLWLYGDWDAGLTGPVEVRIRNFDNSAWVTIGAYPVVVPDGDKGDLTTSSSGTVWTIDNGVVTLAKIQNASANSKLLGSGDAGAGAPYAEITLGTGLTMTGTTLDASGGGGVDLEDDGTPEGTGIDTIDFTGAGVTVTDDGSGHATVDIPGAALADGDYGDITASGSGSVLTIDSAAVTLAKIQNAAANSKLLGSGDAGAGNPYAEISLGTGLSMSGTTLSSSGSLPQFLTDLNSGHPDAYPGSPSAYDDEFAAGSLDAKWTNVNSSTIAFASSRMTVTLLSSSTDSLFRQAFVPGAGVAFTVIAKFTGLLTYESTDFAGLMVLDSGNAVIAACDYRFGSANQAFNKDNPGGTSNVSIRFSPDYCYLKITRDASNNYQWGISFDGLAWSQPHTGSSSSTTVSKLAFRFGQTASRSYKKGSIDWFRVS